MARMETQVEELADNRVRLQVEVGSDDVRHAVEHAASNLAETMKIPGFRKGRVPMPVLVARVGRERLYSEAVESHIGGWFRAAAARSRIRPVDQPEFGYEPPASAEESFHFTATVAVQPKPEVPDWHELEVPYVEPDVPAELVEQELEALRSSVAELVPVGDRPVAEGDTLVVDLVDGGGEAQRDYVVELGQGRLLDELEAGLVGMSIGETKTIEAELADGSTATIEATVKEIKEKVLPELDDDLARSTSEFETLAELREDIESRLRDHLELEAEAAFRQEVVRALAEAAKVEASGPLVEARARTLLQGLALSLERRGIALDTREGTRPVRDNFVDPGQQGVIDESIDSDGDRADVARGALVRHLLAPAERAHRLPRHAGRRPDREPDRRPAPPPRVRGPGQGHLDLHQLAGRLRLRGARDLRHDAVHQARRLDDLRRDRDVDGRAPACRWREREADGAAERKDPDPPGDRWIPGAGHRHRDPGARGDRAEAPDGRDHRRAHRPAARPRVEGHGARLLHEPAGSEGVRHHRQRDRPSSGGCRGSGCGCGLAERAIPR